MGFYIRENNGDLTCIAGNVTQESLMAFKSLTVDSETISSSTSTNLEFEAGENVTLEVDGNTVTFSASGGTNEIISATEPEDQEYGAHWLQEY